MAKSQAMIEIKNVIQSFRTGFWMKPSAVLSDVSFSVPRGCVFGLLGPNGAGKTTLIHLLAGIRRPSAGTVRIEGRDCSMPDVRRSIGYLPERPYFYDHLTGTQFLRLGSDLLGVKREQASAQIPALLQRVGLASAADRELRLYSKGMLQRIGFAQALLGDPKLLILDEPMSGLDPVGRREMRDLIQSANREGKTILLSSHVLSDVEALCSDVVILQKGRVVEVGSLESISDAHPTPYEIMVKGLALPRFDFSAQATASGNDIKMLVPSSLEANAALATLMREGYVVKSFGPTASALERWFEREKTS